MLMSPVWQSLLASSGLHILSLKGPCSTVLLSPSWSPGEAKDWVCGAPAKAELVLHGSSWEGAQPQLSGL